MNRKAMSIEEFLPIMLSGAGAIGVLPFAVIRLMNGEIKLALLDSLIVFGLGALAIYVLRTRRTRVASILVAIVCIGGTLATIYIKGTAQIFWLYPALTALFFLVKPREAIVATVVALLLMIPVLLPNTTAVAMTTLYSTLLMTCVFAYAFAVITSRQRDQLMRLATKDPLTGAGNRRGLEEKLEDVIAVHRRRRTPASLIILDLDHFKLINDKHGHATGDEILIRLTEIINLRIRITDSLYRIGGEEFVVVTENADLNIAARLSEQLRTLIEANELLPEKSVTISLGAAELQPNESSSEWLMRADTALYEAKRLGRNRTSLSAGDGSLTCPVLVPGAANSAI